MVPPHELRHPAYTIFIIDLIIIVQSMIYKYYRVNAMLIHNNPSPQALIVKRRPFTMTIIILKINNDYPIWLLIKIFYSYLVLNLFHFEETILKFVLFFYSHVTLTG